MVGIGLIIPLRFDVSLLVLVKTMESEIPLILEVTKDLDSSLLINFIFLMSSTKCL